MGLAFPGICPGMVALTGSSPLVRSGRFRLNAVTVH